MGSFRFRRTVKIAPGVRLNINKKSVGLSAGVTGARISKNTDGQGTRSVGIPGTGLYWREQTRPGSSANPSSLTGAASQPAIASDPGDGAQAPNVFDGFIKSAELLGQFPGQYVVAFKAEEYVRAVEMRQWLDDMIAAADEVLRIGLEDERPDVAAVWAQFVSTWEDCKRTHYEFLADQDEQWPIPDPGSQAYIQRVSGVRIDAATLDGGSLALSFTLTPETLAYVSDRVTDRVIGEGGSPYDLQSAGDPAYADWTEEQAVYATIDQRVRLLRQVKREVIIDTITGNADIVAQIGEAEASRAADRLADAVEAATSSG